MILDLSTIRDKATFFEPHHIGSAILCSSTVLRLWTARRSRGIARQGITPHPLDYRMAPLGDSLTLFSQSSWMVRRTRLHAQHG